MPIYASLITAMTVAHRTWAWIETSRGRHYRLVVHVAHRTWAWIETERLVSDSIRRVGRPPYVGVD